MTGKRDDELTADDRHSRLDQQHDRKDRPPPLPVSVAQPWTSDQKLEPTTNPGLKLTPEQLAEARALDPSSAKVAATPAYVKVKQEEAKREFRLADVKWFFATLAAVGTFALSAWGAATGVLKERIDAGVEPTKELATRTEKRVDVIEPAVRRLELEQVRANTMLENLSRERGLPVPPPAPKVESKDGGSP